MNNRNKTTITTIKAMALSSSSVLWFMTIEFIIYEKHAIGIINIFCELKSPLQCEEGDSNMQKIMNWNSVLIIWTNENACPFHTNEHKKLQNKIIAIQNIAKTIEITRTFSKKVVTCHKLLNCATRIESEVRSLLWTKTRSPRHYDMNRKKTAEHSIDKAFA